MTFETIPKAIWMPGAAELPACYQGSPIEMVEAMANEMKPGLAFEEAMEHLLASLEETRDIQIHLPEVDIEYQAVFFVGALLAAGIARPMASA